MIRPDSAPGITFTAAAACSATLLAPPALAQTGAPLLLAPWDADDTRIEATAEGLFMRGVDIDDTDADADLSLYESRGRYKLTTQPGPGPAVGYDLFHLDVSGAGGALPKRLVDVSGAVALGHRINDQWEVGLVVGAGYAGVRPFADADSLYLLGDLIASYRIDDQSSLTFNLNYNGNRSLLPDVPLPAVSYYRRSSDQLSYIVGFPYSLIRWSPADRWLIELGYTVPLTVEATATYELADNLDLFGSVTSLRRGFWIEDIDLDRRIFFRQTRAEVGVRYGAHENVELILAGGYAFRQEFETGWDVRDLETVRELDNAPYLRLAIDVAF